MAAAMVGGGAAASSWYLASISALKIAVVGTGGERRLGEVIEGRGDKVGKKWD